MYRRSPGKKLSSFQIIILGFLGLILIGTLLLMLPVSSAEGSRTSLEDALFTATSAVCVTGLVVRDTALSWSYFGQAVILLLIQIGGLGVISVAAFIAAVSGKKISLLQRSVLQDSISAHEIGGVVRMTRFIFKIALIVELLGTVVMLPAFCGRYGSSGVWMAVFHSVSAFCNAGFDIMGSSTGQYSSLTSFGSDPGVVIPVVLLIVIGGLGFLTWDDIASNKLYLKRYRMQSKVVLLTTAVLIVIPALILFFFGFSDLPAEERLYLSLFQSVTPRTAGFNTADITALSGPIKAMLIVLMIIGGSPGSTAGGMKTTTFTVILANAVSVFLRKKHVQLFSRRVEDSTVKCACALLAMYVTLVAAGAFVISAADGLPMGTSLFEAASAIGTVGLTMGVTPDLCTLSHAVLILLMFFGRAGGLTLVYAAVSGRSAEVSQRPMEKIVVG